MPILDLQRRMLELGRIRTGVTVESKGKSRPEKLETFRLTSPSRDLIDAAAAALGGVAQPWQDEFEVITSTDTLEIMVPPGEPLSQWYEMWTAGGCVRRCNGEVMVLTDEPCLCPQDPGDRRAGAAANPPTACKPTTRLNVMLTALPGLGVWRLETHGFYAAVELAGAASILAYATSAGHPIPARLRLEPRTKKVPGQPTHQYAVPVIEIIDRKVIDLLPPRTDLPQLAAGGTYRHEADETALPDGSDFRAPVDAGLSSEALTAWITANGIAHDRAIATMHRLFPDQDPAVRFDGSQRAALQAELQREITELDAL